MAHMVTCPYCKEKFDRDKVPFKLIGARRYAHVHCAEEAEKQLSAEEQDKKALEEYIMKLLNETFINPRVRKQIKEYINNYNYTYSGMLKALIYFYEIKKNDTSKANGGIGIIPYVYNDAFNYYYAIWEAQQKNTEKVLSDYTVETQEVFIPIPQRKIKKRELFTFLDEGEDINVK